MCVSFDYNRIQPNLLYVPCVIIGQNLLRVKLLRSSEEVKCNFIFRMHKEFKIPNFNNSNNDQVFWRHEAQKRFLHMTKSSDQIGAL